MALEPKLTQLIFCPRSYTNMWGNGIDSSTFLNKTPIRYRRQPVVIRCDNLF